MQPNGYKPTPLDLSSIILNEKKLDLVELLAENTHNVWARDRIKQGWTYGLNEVLKQVKGTGYILSSRAGFGVRTLDGRTGFGVKTCVVGLGLC